MSKTCANCGAEVPEGARFCDNCGMPVSEAPPSQEPSSQEAPTEQTSPTSPPLTPPVQPPSPPLPPPPPVEQPPISVPPPPQQGGSNRGLLLLLGGGFVALLVIGGSVWGLVSYFQDGDVGGAETAGLQSEVDESQDESEEPLVPSPPSEEEPAPGYQRVEHESGNLSVEVPSGWEVDSEKYSDFEGNDVSESEGIGPAITASTDLYTWNNIAGEVPGVYIRASRVLAQRFDEDQLLDSSAERYLVSCERGARQDFARSPYSGKVQELNNCGGTYDQLLIAAAPESGECLLTLQVLTFNEADRETAQHVLDTFEADCEGIN